jgi:glycosyltransferase involved in cell wall biosynthesis
MPINERLQGNTYFQTEHYLKRASSYKRWRELNLYRLNNYVDEIYAVSAIVKERAVKLGVNREKVTVAPLGMDVYRKPADVLKLARKDWEGEKLRIAFMGYPIPSKGLPFLSESLEQLDQQYKDKIELIIISKIDELTRKRIIRLMPQMEVKFLHGYERSQLEEVSGLMDLLVMPPIWWETFNQVTYEMIMQGIPVLISDSVGISSFINDEFIFESSNIESLNQSLVKIIDRRVLLEEFWDTSSIKDIPDVARHIKKITS